MNAIFFILTVFAGWAAQPAWAEQMYVIIDADDNTASLGNASTLKPSSTVVLVGPSNTELSLIYGDSGAEFAELVHNSSNHTKQVYTKRLADSRHVLGPRAIFLVNNEHEKKEFTVTCSDLRVDAEAFDRNDDHDDDEEPMNPPFGDGGYLRCVELRDTLTQKGVGPTDTTCDGKDMDKAIATVSVGKHRASVLRACTCNQCG